MTACGEKWCVALAETQYCVVHDKHPRLRPTEIDEVLKLEELQEASYTQGYNEGYAVAMEELGDEDD